MSEDVLTITVERDDRSAVVTYELRGTLDIATSPELRAALSQGLDKHVTLLIVDLTQVEFIDSTGLGVLIGTQRRTVEAGSALRLVVPEGPISRLLAITGLNRILAVYHTRAAALSDGERTAPV